MTTDTTASAVESTVANYSFLKFVDGQFTDLVVHYVNMWQIYHQALAKAAMIICMMGGIAWVGVLALKAPVDKLQTAAAGIFVVILTGMLLSPGDFTIGTAPKPIALSAGAGWSLQIVGNIYALFKSALDSVNQEDALKVSFDNAYHVTNQGTVDRFIKSPIAQMYNDYVRVCQAQLESTAGNNVNTRKFGRAVGLFGSSAIADKSSQLSLSKKMYELLASGKNLGLSLQNNSGTGDFFSLTTPGEAFSEGQIISNTAGGMKLLGDIPKDANTYFDGQTPVGGYQLPTSIYWANTFKNSSGTPIEGAEFEDATGTYADFQNSAYTNSADTLPAGQAQGFYPKNCLSMFVLLTQAVKNYNDAADKYAPSGESTAIARDGVRAQTILTTAFAAHEAQQKLKLGANFRPYTQFKYKNQETPNIVDTTLDGGMNLAQDTGMAFKEAMLKYEIPGVINGCAMLAGFLVVLFPLICVFAVFVAPKPLITYVKLLVLAFTVPFINDLCLSMSATTLAMNGELLDGYNAGSSTENWPLLISAASAQYIIFAALAVIEIMIAKMLIWDDVSSLSSFKPGAAVTGMAARGIAVTGALLKLGSMLGKGGGLLMSPIKSSNGGGGGGGQQPSPVPRSLASTGYGQGRTNYASGRPATPASRTNINLNPTRPNAPASSGSNNSSSYSPSAGSASSGGNAQSGANGTAGGTPPPRPNGPSGGSGASKGKPEKPQPLTNPTPRL